MSESTGCRCTDCPKCCNSRPSGKELVVFDFLVYRQEGLTPSNFMRVVLKFDPDYAPARTPDGMIVLNELLQNGVEAWARSTESGQSVYEYSGTDMNFGDIAGYAERIMEFIPGCVEFRLESIEASRHFTYDSSLCGDLDDEA